MSEKLINAIIDLEEEEAHQITNELLESGIPPMEILSACQKAMDGIGERFEKGQYFIPELMLAGEMMTDISAVIKPLIQQDGGVAKKGKVLVGTVKGDIHDIGKDIVSFMLDINGFEVKDIGVDIPAETFVSEIKDFQPDIVALSGFLTLAFGSMKDTVEAIKDAGLREGVKVMIGGGTIDQKVCEYAGADAFGSDAVAAVNLANQWVGEA